MALSTYIGFSTKGYPTTGSFDMHDIDIVKEDLLNHIYTEVGERVHLPDFGTRIGSLVFEPNDEETQQIIHDDLMKVFLYDPRVEVISLNILPFYDNNAIVAEAQLLFVEFDVTDTLNIEIISN